MVSRKIIKKIVQLAVILLLIVITIPVTGFILLQSNRIQTNVVSRIVKAASEKLNTTFKIKSVEIAFPYRIRLNDVYLEDLSGDTIIFVKHLTAGIRYINPLKKKVSIGSIDLDKAIVSLAIDSAYNLNLNYFIDKLSGDGKKGEGGWEVEFNNIKLHKSKFGLRNFYYKPRDYGMNFTDIQAYNIDAELKRFRPSKDSLSFYVKNLSLKEKGGLQIERMSTEFSQHRTFLSFREILINTPYSHIKGGEITMRFKNFNQFKADSFAHNVKFRISLNETLINFHDIGYFAPAFMETDLPVNISGFVSGPLSNIRASDMVIGLGKHSKLSGTLSMEGLPDIRETFIIADIQEFTSSSSDIGNIEISNKKVKLPVILNKLGLISYVGNFTGFINDFVAYGKFDTELGTIKTDLLFRPDTLNLLDFQGKINVNDFYLGSLLNASDKIGYISLSATIDGATLEGNTFDATLKGMVERFEFLNYNYTNISLSGDLKDKTFNGSVNVKDPNIDLEFLGKVNFTDSVPEFNFTANVTDADLYDLHLSRSDPDFRTSFYLIANARGNSINSLNGEIKLVNSLFVKKEKQLQIYDLSIKSHSMQGNNTLQLRSDFIDADLSGNFELTKAGKSLQQFLYTYLPSAFDSAKLKEITLNNSISFTSTIKNITPIFNFFLPGYEIAENSTINLKYQPDIKQMNLHLQSAYVNVNNLKWENLNLLVNGNEDLLDFEAGSKVLIISNRIRLENFTSLISSSSDTANIKFRWNNWEDLQYRGNIYALAKISRDAGSKKPRINIKINPSRFVTNDTIWAIQPANINIDSSSVRFNNITISHENEFFKINGTLSEGPTDVIDVTFNQFNLANLNGITSPSGYNLAGILNGNGKLSSFYSEKLFTSTLKIDSLVTNGEMIGNMEINSSWDDKRKAILIDAYALRNNLRTINLKGEYLPSEQGKLDFNLQLEKLRLNLFNPYIKTIFTDIRGIASGKASLTGTLSKPILQGKFAVQKTSFTINYLQTRYNFSDTINIENNNIYFDNIKISDPKGNVAYLNGAIRNKYLKDFNLDLTIRSHEFMSLNTSQVDNKQFYGTAYATGVIKITGPPKNLFLDITATTNNGTSIKIPLSDFGELNEYPFITINNPVAENDTEEEQEYEVDLSGIQIRFKLIVTPDAEVQIIIDPQLGEIIKGRGTGNLDMRISSSGDFIMNGEYEIEEGEYLLTLQKVITKRLNIEPGGTIRWDGDPLDATINIAANYRIPRASVNDLFGIEESKRGQGNDLKVTVDDKVFLTGKLMAPDIRYDINLPDADEGTRLKVNSVMTTSEEKSRQFISLLVTNRFALSQNMVGQLSGGSSAYSGAAGVNFSELLSNQLSNWLSQIVNDLDVDFNYRSNREMNSEEVQLALSYQLFNDKLTINGSVDMATNAARDASDEIVGEFDIDYKLTRNGKLRIKTFNHSNNEILYEDQSSYTQGLGLSYKEEFSTFGELIRRLFGKKEDGPEPVTVKEKDKEIKESAEKN